jgi:prepilin-type N-terminal cleavage/methylation domain-containing protein
MNGMRQRKHYDDGFTLLELLVVIAVFGLILAALTAGVRFAGQAWEIQQRRAERQGDLDAVQNVLRQLIASGIGFQGNAVSLHFVSTLPLALARAGLYDVELRMTAGSLVLAWRPHFKGPAQNLEETETELTKGVTDIALSYSTAAGGWQRVSQDRNAPPALIRVALELGDGRTWPPLIVAPMIEVQPAATN